VKGYEQGKFNFEWQLSSMSTSMHTKGMQILLKAILLWSCPDFRRGITFTLQVKLEINLPQASLKDHHHMWHIPCCATIFFPVSLQEAM